MLLSPTATLLAALTLSWWPSLDPGPDPVGTWPLRPEPEVVEAFRPPSSPYGPGHRGVDLLGRAGQPVRAALDGEVSFAGRIAGRGVVVVSHGATRTTYEPVAASASLGDAVVAGDVLGRLEVAPSHCVPRTCLHWGWIEGGGTYGDTYLDPLRLVGQGPVRLLPLEGAPTTATRPTCLAEPARTDPGDRLRSGSGVCLPVGGAEPVGGDMGVDLGGGQRGVAQQLLHGAQVGAALEQVGGSRVP
ncbi:Peptidase family M23 [Nocardioides dokdonensis FR1436]|uniref:Peptidase family M23 n=1 Tax=Nocardioides dokdonensis FR1436 TaxID=1300347 RepID=A0A1A9GKY4_9ACTN|nr:Peptidase family M23 [Nocardioides dokdonensis FR1436]